MIQLPVFSTIGQALSTLGLYFWKILLWLAIYVVIGCVPLGVVVVLSILAVVAHGGLSVLLASSFGLAALLAFFWLAALLWLLWASAPWHIRIYQLVIFGRVQPVSYLKMIFTARASRFVGYSLLVGLIAVVGFVLAAIPAVVGFNLVAPHGAAAQGPAMAQAMAQHGAVVLLGFLVSFALVIAFMVLVTPLQLTLPAVSVEEQPSMGRAYNLATGNKWRLFWSAVLVGLIFAVINLVIRLIGMAFGSAHNPGVALLFTPISLFVTLFSAASTTSVYAVAYRIFSGLPDPRAKDGPPAPNAAGM